MHWGQVLFETFLHTVVISAFVFMMMVIVEYANVRFKGRLASRVGRRPLVQSTVAGGLGLIPGCLGAFASVALYEHGILSFGALVCCMIAASGDEAFVMLAMAPKAFLVLALILFLTGVLTGILVDAVLRRRFVGSGNECSELIYHEEADDHLVSFVQQIRCNFARGNLGRWAVLIGLIVFFILMATGVIDSHGHDHDPVGAGGAGYHGWIRIVLIAVTAFAIAVTVVASRHFVSEHVIGHVAKRHLPSIFLWVFGTLIALKIAGSFFHIETFVIENRWWLLLVACLAGIIPQSGPHLVFVTLFAQGALPFSILLGSSIVQDGHGALPLLAFSRKDFLLMKAINLAVGLAVSAVAMVLGF